MKYTFTEGLPYITHGVVLHPISYEDEKIAWNCYCGNSFWADFARDRKRLSHVDTANSILSLVDRQKHGLRVSLKIKIKNGKAVGPSGVISEMVKVAEDAGEAVVDMITDLVNQIIVRRVIPPEWELTTFVNCFKRKGYYLEKANYRGLKLKIQILRITEKITKLI